MTWFEKTVLKIIFYWLLVFFTGRIFFILFNYSDLSSETIGTVLQSFYYGIKMDLSALSYINIFPILLLFVFFLTKRTSWIKYFRYYVLLTSLVYFIIITSELSIYTEWHTKLNVKAISYLQNVNEVWKTASRAQVFITLFFVPLLTYLSYLFINRLFTSDALKENTKVIRSSFVLLLTIGVFVVWGRGGLSGTSLSISSAFYSSNNRTLNYTAVNSYWHFLYNVYKYNKYSDKDKFKFLEPQEANRLVAQYKAHPKGEQEYILHTSRPNIIIILLESWTADLVDSLSTTYNLMPNWNHKLRKEALYFNHCYASGVHSEEGIIAVYTGFPGLSSSYIMGSTEKVMQLPSIIKVLDKEKYNAAFYFGGDLSYANISSFFYNNPFKKIVDEKTFPSKYPKGSLNYQDEFLFKEMLNYTEDVKEPFFLGGFTGSTHSPYDIPTGNIRDYGKMNAYMNSAHYADSCLWHFYNSCKTKEWFKNTIFIFVADHSHATPVERKFGTKETFRIPLLIAGGALKEQYRGRIFDKIVSQNSIPALLLGQMDLENNDFTYSINPFKSDYFPYANYAEKMCLGSVTQEASSVFYFDNTTIYSTPKGVDSLVLPAKAILQKAYRQYLNY